MTDQEADTPEVAYPVGVDSAGRVVDASGREVDDVRAVLAVMEAKPDPSMIERQCMEAIRRRLRATE